MKRYLNLKRIYLKLFMLFILLPSFGGVGGGLYAQDPELFEHTWYLQKIVLDDGTEHIPIPNEDILYITLSFFDEMSYYFETTVCNSFYADIDYQPGNVFLIIHSETTLLLCEPEENFYFEGIQFGFFLEGGDHITDPFLYTITTNGNEKTLVITNARGDEAIYGNQLLSVGQNESTQFAFHPNPVQETLHISQNSYQFVTATIYDVQGKKLLQHTLGNSISTIDVRVLNPGLYFLVMESESGDWLSEKFVKN